MRTYVFTLRKVMQAAHHYATRWQTQLSAHLTTAQYNCLVSTIQAIADCLALLGEQPYNP